MRVTVNGDEREVPEDLTVAELVASLPGVTAGRGVAVAVGGEVLPRGLWESTQLSAGNQVEVLVAVQGG
jgi:sulfur carrier protein